MEHRFAVGVCVWLAVKENERVKGRLSYKNFWQYLKLQSVHEC